MSEPEITTVIPTYKRPKLLERAVRSVLAQTYPHLTVKVFDNASGDETADVIGRIAAEDDRVHYHCHERNLGAHANFEYALASVQTPYFSILSDDDVLLPGFFAHATDCLASHGAARFFCGQTVVYNTSSRSHRVRPIRLWHDGFYQAGSSAVKMGWDSFTWTACLFTRDMLAALTPLDPVFGDTSFMMRAPALFPFCISLVPCAVLTAHENTTSASTRPAHFLHGCAIAMEQLSQVSALTLDDLRELEDSFRLAIRKAVGKHLTQAFLEGHWDVFEEAAGVLRKTGEARGTQKLLCMIASRRTKSGPLMRLAGAYLARRARQKRSIRAPGNGGEAFEDVVARYERDAIQKPAPS
jgi:hypothetical protein